jgi:hypothetical protein
MAAVSAKMAGNGESYEAIESSDYPFSFTFPINGFSGSMFWAPRDGWRGYNQPRGVHILYGKGEKHNKVLSDFTLQQDIQTDIMLALSAVDDSAIEKNNINILINGKSIFLGKSPFENCTNGRNMTGRKIVYFKVPATVLRKGTNRLEIINLTSCLKLNRLPWLAFDSVELLFKEEMVVSVGTKARVAWGVDPLTPCLYPAQALDYTITGLAGQPVQCTLMVRTGKGFEQHIGTDYSVGMEFPSGTRLEMYKKGALLESAGSNIWMVKEKSFKKSNIGYLVRGTEKGFLIIAPDTPGKEYQVTLWIKFDGDEKRYYEQNYTLKVAEAIKPRKNKTPFSINTWARGGIVADKPEVSRAMLTMLKTLGVTSNWIGKDPEAAKILKDNGINAIIQRNWYGVDPAMVKKDTNAVSYDHEGNPSPNRVRPFYQYNYGKEFDAKILGGWRKDAEIKDVWACGTDFEGNYEDLSFDSASIKQFQKIMGIKESNPKVIWEKHLPEWIRFRGWEASQIMRVAADAVKKVDPEKKWVVFSDGGDLSTYWWHKPIPTNTRAIAKYADMMCTSLYYYDTAGAIKSIAPYSQMMLRAMPVEKAVPTLIFMVYPTEFEYFGFLRQPAWSVKQSTILLGLNGMEAVSWFAGFQMDGIYLRAIADAVKFMDKYYPVVEKGEMLPDLVDVKMREPDIKDDDAFFEVSGAPSFYDACRWLPGKELWFTKVVWFYRDSRYIFLANHVAEDLTFDVRATGYTDRKWKVTTEEPEEKLLVNKLELGEKMWSPAFTVKVPAHDITVIKMKRIE